MSDKPSLWEQVHDQSWYHVSYVVHVDDKFTDIRGSTFRSTNDDTARKHARSFRKTVEELCESKYEGRRVSIKEGIFYREERVDISFDE